MVYFISRNILKLLFKICFRTEVYGRENLPTHGPVIIASNHASFLDPIIVGTSIPRKLNFMAKDSLFKVKIFGKILTSVNAFPVKRGNGDINAFRTAIDRLTQKKVLLIFPEGTRSRDGNLQKPRYGIGLLSAVSGATILPCYIKGSMEALQWSGVFPRFKDISVYFGKPLEINMKDYTGARKERYMQVALQTMAAIGKLKENAD